MTISTLIGGCSGTQPKAVNTSNKYPNKPITMIVPFGVGGAQDLVARIMEKEVPKFLGQPLVIVNKPGSAGAIGWNELAGSSPDGYTIGITSVEVLVLPLYGSSKYNYPTALQPLAQITSSSWAVAVQAEQPWQNIDDLISYAKQHPGIAKFSHSGVGSFSHILGEMICKDAEITLQQVPFRSANKATTALLGGHVQVAIVNPSAVKEHMKNGTVRVLAVTGEQRLADPDFADVPTLKEQGFNMVYENWFAIAAPKEIPPEVKAKLVEGLKAMTEDTEFQNNIKSIGSEVKFLGPKETEPKWLSDNQKLSKIVHETGILDLIKAQKK
ncbi:MAG: tripartite tricarboxylate transporter substrate binding protein [Anaerolineaceae bacterium]